MASPPRISTTWPTVAAWLLPVAVVAWLVSVVVGGEPPEPIPPPEANSRFGVAEEKRREVFEAIARHTDGWRKAAANTFPERPYRAEDDFRNRMRRKVQAYTGRFDLDRTTIWLIVDEGVRKRWEGPSGEPLRATTVPLHKNR